MRDMTYFAMDSNGPMFPIGTRDDLVDEMIARGIHRLAQDPSIVRIEREPVETATVPSAPHIPQIVLTTFGVCAVVGAFTIARWIWFAVG